MKYNTDKLDLSSVQSRSERLKPEREKSKRVYFPGLNSLRFIAASVVIIHHVEQIKSLFGYQNYFDNIFVHNIGGYGVTFFFALSGFLITYLLLVEQARTRTISIKSFYIRRTLRIWPLYYLLGILSLAILPHVSALNIPVWQDELADNYFTQAILYITFLPNLALSFFGTIPHANQVWSVGVEEQFYLIWPLVVKYSRSIWHAILKVMGIYLVIKSTLIAMRLMSDGISGIAHLNRWSQFVEFSRIDCMAIGALGAAVLYYYPQTLRPFYRLTSQYLLYALTLLFLIYGGVTGGILWHFNQEIFAILSTAIVLNIATNRQSIFKLQNQSFDYLGRISYGLYMYHCLCIAIAFYLVDRITTYSLSGFAGNAIAYPLSIIITILVSAASYHWLEKPFIRYKHKFVRVASGDRPS